MSCAPKFRQALQREFVQNKIILNKEQTHAYEKKHGPAFKFEVALEALKGRPAVDICCDYEVATSSVHKWKTQTASLGIEYFDIYYSGRCGQKW